jgi:ParB family transcriptional regulator, chromosome partitioning protein
MGSEYMELKMLDMKKIVTNPLQPRQDFDREKLQELANSIKEGELLQPIVVRKRNSKTTEGDIVVKTPYYEIVCGERRYKAFQILKEPKIPAIVREIKDDTDALEKSLIENLQRDNLTSVERENAVGSLWDSKRYTTQNELARKLGMSYAPINHMILSREFRQKEKVAATISTRTLTDTMGLKNEPRKKLLDAIEKDKIRESDVRDVVRKVKEFPEPEQQLEILQEFEEQEEQSKEIFNGVVEKYRRIAKQEIEPEHYKENNADMIRLESIKDIYTRASSITSFYIKKIESDKQRNEAIQYMQKTIIHLTKVINAFNGVNV